MFLADGRDIFLRNAKDGEPVIKILDKYATYAKTTMFSSNPL